MQKFTLVFLFLLCASAYSQETFAVSGVVVYTNRESVPFGDVTLFFDNMDAPLKYTAIENGRFVMESIKEGSYRLQISGLGLETKEMNLKVNKNLSLNIEMNAKTTDLNEVQVTAAKAVAVLKNGNLKIDVDNPIFSSIPDALELLGRLPGIQMSPDRETLTLLGKGTPLLYLGRQRISLNELKALSVDTIKSIEIVRNPSAKYEASGRAVLLITLKKENGYGSKLNFSETASFRQNFNAYHGLNGSLKKDRWTVQGNFNYNDLLQWESHTFRFGIPEQRIVSDYSVSIDRNVRNEIQTGGRILHEISENDYFSFNIAYRLQTNDAPIATETLLSQQLETDFIRSNTQNDNTKNFVTTNFNYNKKLGKSLNLFMGLQYSDFTQRLDTDISNNFNSIGDVLSELRQQKYRIGVWAYRFDLEKDFESGFKLEVGANVSRADADADTQIDFLGSETDTDLDYTYQETTYASYAQVSGGLGKTINLDIGLRIENNQVKGEIDVDSAPIVNRENTAFFPKVGLNVAVDSTKTLTLNYARSIDRPDYSRASSITTFINPFLEGSGNVNLLPTFSEELTASYLWKKGSISFTYLNRKNPMYFTIGYETGADRAVLSQKNLESESGYDMNLTVPMTKGIWSSNNTLMLSMRHIKDQDAVMENARPYLYAYTDQRFQFWKNATISFGGWVMTKRFEGIFRRNAMAVFNISLAKTFFKKLDIALRWNDITRAMNFEESYSINGVFADGIYFVDAREVALSINYNLGKAKNTDLEEKDIDENLDRIR